jgi:hypothetical protein
MRELYTAHLEIKRDFTEDFETGPYECGWAREGIFFIRAEEVSGENATLEARAQFSADGLFWVDEGAAFEPISDPGLCFIRLDYLRGWLRLACSVSGQNARFRLLMNIALKD